MNDLLAAHNTYGAWTENLTVFNPTYFYLIFTLSIKKIHDFIMLEGTAA
jgi:hypothetical protein